MAESVSLAQILEAHHKAETENSHTCLPCKVVSYDAATQTVAAKPLVKRPGFDADGNTKYEELPTYPNVQVAFPRAGSLVFYMPIASGDFGHLVFCDMATGEARSTGQVSEPQDVSRHAGGYCIFIPGGYPDTKALSDHGVGHIGIDGDVSQVEFEAGVVRVGKGASDFVVLASALKTLLDSAITAGIAGAVANDGGHAALTALKSALDTGWSSVPATAVKAK